ncbi:hypothetical protein [Puniceibacterium antarcticum]|nr:hypothetical protein [Puniceibacterium antarcticum]
MRGFLSELGCLPVLAMVHIPKLQEVLAGDGTWCGDAEQWDGYLGRTLERLDWWTEAAQPQRNEDAIRPTRHFSAPRLSVTPLNASLRSVKQPHAAFKGEAFQPHWQRLILRKRGRSAQ